MGHSRFATAIILVILGSGFGVSSVAGAPVRVVATTSDFAAIARAVGGSAVEVESLVRGDQDPHAVEVRPSLILKVSRADLFIQGGAGLEAAWVSAVVTAARNPRIQPGVPGFLDLSTGIELRDVPTERLDRSRGDVHPDGNPHYWLDPENGFRIAGMIADRIETLIPDKRDEIRRNERAFGDGLREGIVRWHQAMAPFRGTAIVTYHDSWRYLTERFGLTVVGHLEPKPGIPPSPAHLDRLIHAAREAKVRLIVTEPFFSKATAGLVGRQSGAAVLILSPSIGGDKAATGYIELFDSLIGRLADALSERGAP